jgi:hypothetical protein
MLKLKFLDPLLKINPEGRNWIDIIIWWELRRILYNLIVLIAGITSILIMVTVASGIVHLEPGEDFYEPIMIPVFAFFCNMGYTLGWMTELFIKPSKTYGKNMFKFGLKFTLFWVFLPSALWVGIAIFHLVKKLF